MPIQIELNNEQTVLPVTEDLHTIIYNCLHQAARREQVTAGEVSVTLVDDEAIHLLNKKYRQVDRPTDVLSFPMEDDLTAPEASGMVPLLGDIVVSVPRAAEQAREYGHSLERELGFLVTHGFLHLLGYDHDSEEAEHEMIRRQEEVLSALGLTR